MPRVTGPIWQINSDLSRVTGQEWQVKRTIQEWQTHNDITIMTGKKWQDESNGSIVTEQKLLLKSDR